VTFEGPFKKEASDNNYTVGEDLADYLVEGLKERGFEIKSVEDVEFAFLIKCISGTIKYEIMVGLDSIYNRYWEVSLNPRYGFFSRLLGQIEEKELEELLKGIHTVLKLNSSIVGIRWYKSYGDQDSIKNKDYSTYPVDV